MNHITLHNWDTVVPFTTGNCKKKGNPGENPKEFVVHSRYCIAIWNKPTEFGTSLSVSWCSCSSPASPQSRREGKAVGGIVHSFLAYPSEDSSIPNVWLLSL